MHRCSSGGVGGQCLCGMAYHCGGSSSMFFNSDPPPLPDHSYTNNYSSYYQTNNYYNSCPSPSSSVDCTLSLGTPSTRLIAADDDHNNNRTSSSKNNNRRSSGNYVSNFCWDILKGGSSSNNNKSNSRGPAHNTSNDPSLLARRCANCDTTSTPLWRNGPRGPKSLCNACGIRFKKEERRASAAAAGSSSGPTMEHQQYYGYGGATSSSSSSSSKMGCYSPAGEFRFIDHDSNDYDHHHQVMSEQTAGIPSFLSWRLNITDRPALVHDFTR